MTVWMTKTVVSQRLDFAAAPPAAFTFYGWFSIVSFISLVLFWRENLHMTISMG